eukprot:scaffold10185_cov66-Phaeocystis_antarctica.AAC.1
MLCGRHSLSERDANTGPADLQIVSYRGSQVRMAVSHSVVPPRCGPPMRTKRCSRRSCAAPASSSASRLNDGGSSSRPDPGFEASVAYHDGSDDAAAEEHYARDRHEHPAAGVPLQTWRLVF